MRFTKLQKRRIRKNFAKKDEILEIPYLLSVQIESFKRFIEKDPKGKNGIAGIFEKIFPIKSSRGEAELRFIDYELGEPKYTPEECRDRGLTYSRPLNANLRLITYDKNSLNSGSMVVSRSVPSEKPVYFGDIPVMTEHGSFIINGTDNVTVSQLHRAPGVIFEKEIPKNGDQSKGVIYKSRIIPYRGSWIDFSFDNNRDSINLEIDKKKKMPATVLLHAFGYSDSEILAYLYDEVPYRIINGKLYGSITAVSQLSQNNALLATEVRGLDGEVVLQADPSNSRRIGDREFDLFELAYDARGVEYFELPVEVLDSSIIMEDVYSPRTGELLLPANYQFSEEPQEMFDTLVAEGVDGFSTIYLDPENGSYISNTLRIDKTHNADDACLEIYALMNDEGASNASEATQERIDTAKAYFSRLFSNERYDLSPVGRMKLDLGVMTGNKDRDDQLQEVQLTKIVVDEEGHEEAVVITHDERLQKSEIDGRDILDVLYKLCLIRNTGTGLDDVDDLGYRRLRPVGEQIENSFRIGLVRVQKAVQERLNHGEIDSLTPNALINHRPVSSAIREFFTGSKLSQFMDQNNALAEVTHKRRISALGQGGVTRERAGFEVRDVHVTHYGRICPIETPEGQNIGLINSLATYARPNRFGFLETPYRVVKNGKVTDEIKYLSPLDEKQEIYIAQANAKLDKDNNFIGDTVPARLHGNTDMVPVEKIQYMDISSKQTVSIAAALIPFLENDDAKRVLMGANMQKQAVPTLRAEKPLVGTGVENIVAKDSGVSVVAKRGGKINYVDALQIIVEVNPEEIIPDSADPGVDIYNLVKYRRSNQNTVLNQKPSVNIGDVVERGEVIADGSATDLGELALGQNMRVAFMPWNGYNYEDSILVSERVVQQDRFTSIHIQEVTCEARETKNGNEEITADIPNVSNELLSRLDENGIIHIGAEVKTGDILVGRTTPKTDTNTSNYAEMKLLNQIFNVKSAEVKDSSLRVPNSVQGTVIDVQIFTRQDVEKDQRTLAIEAKALKDAEENIRNRAEIIRGGIRHRLYNLMLESGHKAGAIESLSLEALAELKPAQAVRDEVIALIQRAQEELATIPEKIEREKEKLLNYENLKPQVLKQIKVYIAIKRQIQPADKMAGRHGNKGVISKINPVEDMPYDENGTPIDIALNPIGVPSRMNLGQILETHLGLAAKGIGDKIKQMLYRQEKVSKLREFIQEAYNVGHAIQKVNLDDFSDEEVLVLAENLREGLPVASPVFDGAKEEEIHQLLDLAGYPHSGQITLYDGRTGQKFDRPVTVGYMYMLKLNHLVDDKMHARSIGSYSLVTQQPLGGKAQFGGQRFGEMEVWALQAYGAAYNLQEMLTVKSDDIEGRREIFQNILEGRHEMNPHTPELFNVLMKEIKSVGLNMEFIDDSEEDL